MNLRNLNSLTINISWLIVYTTFGGQASLLMSSQEQKEISMTRSFPRFLVITVLCLTLLTAFSVARSPVSSLAAGTNSSSSTSTNWPMHGFNHNHTNYNPHETTINPGNVSQLTLAWSQSISASTEPIVANNVLYVGSIDHNVYAFNATTGAKLWSFQTKGYVFTEPAVVNGVLYVGSDDHNVYALNASTGAKLWSFATGNSVRGSPNVVNGVVYITSIDGFAYALNAQTGAQLWKTSIGFDYDSSPTVAHGMVFVTATNRYVTITRLYALNATTGAVVWQNKLAATNSDDPTVTFVNGVLYVGAGENSSGGYCVGSARSRPSTILFSGVFAFQATTGKTLWAAKTPFGCYNNSTAVANGVVYIASTDGNVYALNASNGSFLWTFGNGSSTFSFEPTVANGIVYVPSNGSDIYGLDATTGAQLWSYSDIESNPITIVNGMVYISSTTLQALSLPKGTR
jgi:outer membrane protein assembly factor BamB